MQEQLKKCEDELRAKIQVSLSKKPGEFEQKNVGEFKHLLIIIESNAAIQITYKITMSHNMDKL